jgi:hypothetical protein
MMPASHHLLLSWHDRPSLRRAAVALLLILALVEGVFAILLRRTDILIHRHNGQAFLAGDPYGPAHVPREIYPVARCMMNALLAIGPLRLTLATCYVLALAAILACYRIWRRLAEQHQQTAPRVTAIAALGTILLASPFVLRDLDECGLQTFTLFFLSAAGLALASGKVRWAGFWLATAAVYKVSPVLVLPFLLWKRQWRAAGWMGAFILGWVLAPVPFLGLDTTLISHQKWLARAIKIASAREAYPSQQELEEPKFYNLSLAALVARYAETYPPDHPLYMDHPAFVQFGNLEPLTAYYVVRGAMLALALLLAWRFRRAWASEDTPKKSINLAHEWAAVCLLCALLAPVCWKQHLILMLPALFLVVHSALASPRAHGRFLGLVVIGVLFLGSKHFVLGRTLSALALSYKIDTVAVLLLLALVLTIAKRREPVQVELPSQALQPFPQAA